jgi:hypothetical protein
VAYTVHYLLKKTERLLPEVPVGRTPPTLKIAGTLEASLDLVVLMK